MMSWIGLHKLEDVIFEITQKPPYITSSKLLGNTLLIKEFFWICFVTWKAIGH